jgi:hypothetical protein
MTTHKVYAETFLPSTQKPPPWFVLSLPRPAAFFTALVPPPTRCFINILGEGHTVKPTSRPGVCLRHRLTYGHITIRRHMWFLYVVTPTTPSPRREDISKRFLLWAFNPPRAPTRKYPRFDLIRFDSPRNRQICRKFACISPGPKGVVSPGQGFIALVGSLNRINSPLRKWGELI